jgi:glycosyltransferase involved in cell wall biosynthesis
VRVLHLIPSFVAGGSESQLAHLANALSARGVDVHVAFVHGGPNLEKLDLRRVQCHRIDSLNNHDPMIAVRLIRLIRSIKPHVVQTWLTQMDILGGFAARACRVPYVLSERSSAAAYPRTWKNALRQWIGLRASAIVANSTAGAEYWNTQRATGRTLVIRNAVVPKQLEASIPGDLSAHGLPDGARLLLFGGRFSPEKNIEVMVQALGYVLETKDDCCALLFGTGPLREQTQAMVRQMALDTRVKLPAYTPNLLDWMRRAELLMSVSHFEGHPNTVMEAMAVGCPLLVSAIPAHREILDDSMARFCNPDSAQDISQALLAVLDDPAGARERAATARQRALTWNIADAAAAYSQLYESLCSRRTL